MKAGITKGGKTKGMSTEDVTDMEPTEMSENWFILAPASARTWWMWWR